MAERSIFEHLVVDAAGNGVPGAQVTLAEVGGGALARSIYSGVSGGSPLGSPTLTADADGYVRVYTDTPGRVQASVNGQAARPSYFLPDPADLLLKGTTSGVQGRLRLGAAGTPIAYLENVDTFSDWTGGALTQNYYGIRSAIGGMAADDELRTVDKGNGGPRFMASVIGSVKVPETANVFGNSGAAAIYGHGVTNSGGLVMGLYSVVQAAGPQAGGGGMWGINIVNEDGVTYGEGYQYDGEGGANGVGGFSIEADWNVFHNRTIPWGYDLIGGGSAQGWNDGYALSGTYPSSADGELGSVSGANGVFQGWMLPYSRGYSIRCFREAEALAGNDGVTYGGTPATWHPMKWHKAFIVDNGAAVIGLQLGCQSWGLNGYGSIPISFIGRSSGGTPYESYIFQHKDGHLLARPGSGSFKVQGFTGSQLDAGTDYFIASSTGIQVAGTGIFSGAITSSAGLAGTTGTFSGAISGASASLGATASGFAVVQRLVRRDGTSAIAALGFDVATAAETASAKAGLALERTASNGRGKLHFLMDNTADTSDVALADSVAYIDANGGWVLGGATGGSGNGLGTLNAKGLYDDNTIVSDWIWDLAYDGRVRDEDRERHGNGRLWSIGDTRAFTEQHRHLPTLPGRAAWAEGKRSLGELVTSLWEQAEYSELHIFNLDERLQRLEALAA